PATKAWTRARSPTSATSRTSRRPAPRLSCLRKAWSGPSGPSGPCARANPNAGQLLKNPLIPLHGQLVSPATLPALVPWLGISGRVPVGIPPRSLGEKDDLEDHQ